MSYHVPQDDTERRAFAEILAESFSVPVERFDERFPFIGFENLRVVRRGSAVAGGLWFIPMGQYFGGRSVPMHGVAGVGVGPDHRGSGVAHEVMASGMRELRERGVALSGLYPATQTLYRKSGYELAGARYEINMAVDRIRVREHGVAARKLTEADHPEVEALYRTVARRRPGYLDRGLYIWDRVYRPYKETPYGYGVWGDEGLEGYMILFHRDREFGFYNITLTDLVYATPRAGRRLLTVLAEHSSMARRVRWYGGPADPTIFLLAEQRYQLEMRFLWMLRITHLEAALAARGYPADLSAELPFALTDDVIPEHNGRFVLRIENGAGSVAPGGNGDLKLDVRDLAALYSGFLPPHVLRQTGRIEGSDEILDRAARIFGGPYPYMPDMF